MEKKAALVTTRTSVQKIKISSKRNLGFTLIEILVVIALIALIMSLAVPQVTLALKVNISNTTRDLATTIRSTYDEAVLKGNVYRIKFDLDKNQYWVEQGERNYLVRTEAQEEEYQKKIARLSKEEAEKFQEPFSLARSITKNKKNLPKGVTFKDIATSHVKKPQSAGSLTVHVFPHGFMENLVVHLKDTYDRESTLIVNPVSGKSRVFDRYVTQEN